MKNKNCAIANVSIRIVDHAESIDSLQIGFGSNKDAENASNESCRS